MTLEIQCSCEIVYLGVCESTELLPFVACSNGDMDIQVSTHPLLLTWPGTHESLRFWTNHSVQVSNGHDRNIALRWQQLH
jgi:hypothetical protein